jgi:hypothetical protein
LSSATWHGSSLLAVPPYILPGAYVVDLSGK